MDELEKYLHNTFPETDSIKKSIDELNQIDLSKISVDELRQKLNSCFPILNYGEVIWDSRFHVFRVRRNFNNDFDPYSNICSIGLPPADKTPFGRANNEYEPIFYGSHTEDLALFESCQNISEIDRYTPQNFTMGIWKVKENEILRLAPILNNDTVKEVRSDMQKASEVIDKLHTDKLTSQKVIEGSRLISKFFSDQFAKSEIKSPHDYKISSFFANVVKNMNKTSKAKFDGILYPSVAHKYRSDNVAIFPQSLYKLKLLKCLSITCYNFDFNQGTLVKGILAEGEVQQNGDILWVDK